MSKEIITRALEAIDERLPYEQFLAEARRQVDALPSEIIEDGIVYEFFDVIMDIKGTMNTAIAQYRKKQ